MKGLLRHIFPLSLRVRFLLATAGVVLVLPGLRHGGPGGL